MKKKILWAVTGTVAFIILIIGATFSNAYNQLNMYAVQQKLQGNVIEYEGSPELRFKYNVNYRAKFFCVIQKCKYKGKNSTFYLVSTGSSEIFKLPSID